MKFTEVFTSCNSSEEFDRSFAQVKGGQSMKFTEVFTSCFSREEFDRSFAPIKGDIK